MSAWWVLWCGHPCAGNPHNTKADAEKWLESLMESARAAKDPVYGDYRIVQSEKRPQ